VYGMGTYVEGVGLHMDGVGMIKDPVWSTIERFAPVWRELSDRVTSAGASEDADGNAAEHTCMAREEAARKLISNHKAVLKDVTDIMPRTQPELERVALFDAPFVDDALREIGRRLLGRRADGSNEGWCPATAEEAKAWAQTTKYLANRLQATPGEKPGREPDMSLAAARAMRAVLVDVSRVALGVWAAFEGAQQQQQQAYMM